MKRTIYVLVLLLLGVMARASEGLPVIRFVPLAGTESEVSQASLSKIIFTDDGIVLVAAEDGAETLLYKYDYSRMEFDMSDKPTALETVNGERQSVSGEKFIRDGQLFIRLDERIYDAQGRRVE